jgi:anti-sigma B factor antagonist
MMQLSVERHADQVIVRLCEARLDAVAAIAFKEAMRQAAAQGEGRVLLDLSEVSFLDSSGLGAIVAVMKMLGPERRLELTGLTPPVAKVFRLTRMDSVFVIHDPKPGEGTLRHAG